MQVDLKSTKFKEELKKTRVFAKEVCDKLKFYPNPIEQENDRIYTGLSRNKIIHGQRYCPCFMVLGTTENEKKENENRVCPCIPALEKEIPQQGRCNCGIFCTEEYINNYKKNKMEKIKEPLNSNKNFEKMLLQDEINSTDLITLLEARKKKVIHFILIDVREKSEYQSNRIIGVDYLIPTSEFYKKMETLKNRQEDSIIVQCHSGGRSSQAQQLMKKMGYKKVINLLGGISQYKGEIFIR